MKKNNPQIPIMLREAAGTQPRIYARYGESRISGREEKFAGDRTCIPAWRAAERALKRIVDMKEGEVLTECRIWTGEE